jgi:putative FmdB family regulatory protein
MPTYGYECLSCDNQFETFQSIKDDALTTCTECGGTLRKRIYPVGISFKGSGFYVNDYAAKPAGGSSSSGGAEAAKTEAASETKTDAKPDTKTEGVKTEPKSETKADSKPEAKAPASV